MFGGTIFVSTVIFGRVVKAMRSEWLSPNSDGGNLGTGRGGYERPIPSGALAISTVIMYFAWLFSSFIICKQEID